MKTEKSQAGKRIRAKGLLIHLVCILAVMITAVLVRTPPAAFSGDPESVREAYTAENGVPYLTDLDSYYHVRLVDNYLNNGTLGDSFFEDGTPRDSRSYYPEGRSAEYQPGIVWLTAGAWRLFGGSLDALEYRISAFFAALSALAAYLVGWRLAKYFGGLAAGLLVGCAPLYAVRTSYGRFDTDMFVVLMELLMILFTAEALRAKTWRGRIAAAVCFALTAAVYSLCWTPTYSMLFAGLTLLGGLIFCLIPLFIRTDERPRAERFFKQPNLWTIVGAGLLSLAGLLVTAGPSAFSFIQRGLSFTTASGSGALPNLLASISELGKATLVPENFWLSFTGYVAGEAPSIINGVGGMVCFILCFAGLIWLCLAAFTPLRGKHEFLSPREAALYFCILTPWLLACFYLTGSGVRFIEHLTIPVGLLAGAFIGRLFAGCSQPAADRGQTGEGTFTGKAAKARTKAKPVSKVQTGARADEKTKTKIAIARILVPVLILAAAVIPAVSGAVRATRDARPSVTDASANAMQFIKEDAQDPDAVAASWWDMGYFYESESGHPCLWDGGTQNGARAILVSKALTSDDLELSRRILLMLSTSGNAAVDLLMEHTNGKTAFDTLWKALLLKKEAACKILEERCGLTSEEAEEAWTLMRPAEPKETYLLITYTMTRQIGWYEYYAGWDFTGEQPLPAVTLYTYTPEGTPLFRSEEGQEFMENVRGKETIWRLFFNAESTSCFTPAFEWHDGMEHVRVWKVES